MSRPTRFFTLGLALLALLVSACSPSHQSQIIEHIQHGLAFLHRGRPLLTELHPVQGGWIIQRLSTDIDSLNPITLESDDAQTISSNISEGLLQVDNFTLKIEPCLAESWEISPDQLTYTFHLRHGVKWHDGQPLTAQDVEFSYERVMDPKVDAAFLRSYFTNIKSCEIVDPYTIRFVATERYFKTLEILGSFLKIVPQHAFAQGDPDFNRNAFARNPIGTGPYKFVRWVTGSQIVLDRNDDYWDKDKAHIRYPARIVFEVVQEPYIAAQLLKKGEIDVFDNVSPIIWKYDLDHSRAIDKCREVIYPYPTYNFLGFNNRLPLFSDVRVRHAIDLLIPRDAILSQIYLNQYATKTSGYDPPSSINYNHAVPPTPTDPNSALQILTDAGWKNDHGDGLLYKDGKPLSFTLLYRAGSPNEEKMVELIQEALGHSGIEVKLSRLEFAQWIERVDDWQFEATMGAWGLDINGDPSQLWSSAQADLKKSSNFIGYKSAQADELIAAGRLEYDDAKRGAIYQQLHQVIHDDYPVCFLFNPQFILLVSNRFHNVKIFPPRPCFDITTWWVPHYRQKYANYK
jgi:peptide/nickel transport system substrate-binding protein